MKDRLIIKKGSFTIVDTDKEKLITAEPSHDGIVFTFKEGFQLYYTDNYMPIHTKDLIKNAVGSFPTAHFTIDLSNFNKPVIVEPTKK